MKTFDYDRLKAVLYARRWAFSRNPKYYSFDGLGGDCTNFISQCVFAGAGVMNYTPVFGWYFRTPSDRTASWTGVQFFYNFLTKNEGEGPFAEEMRPRDLKIGDVIQLGRATGDFYHTLLLTGFRFGFPLVAAHTNDAFDRPLLSYSFEQARYLHILGVRKDAPQE